MGAGTGTTRVTWVLPSEAMKLESLWGASGRTDCAAPGEFVPTVKNTTSSADCKVWLRFIVKAALITISNLTSPDAITLRSELLEKAQAVAQLLSVAVEGTSPLLPIVY
jgi:hypothetical protein